VCVCCHSIFFGSCQPSCQGPPAGASAATDGLLPSPREQVTKSLEVFPEHHESQELKKQLCAAFTML